MKILLLGAKGMLGNYMAKEFGNYELCACDKDDVDITSKEEISKKMNNIKPDFVVNAAAYTDVDGAESNQKLAFEVNAEGVKNLAICCKKNDSILVHVSTDYVFDGSRDTYDEDAKPKPINVYGRSKYAGEKYLKLINPPYYLIRTSWLYGSSGKNFVYAILDLAKKQKEISVVNDQRGSPTYARDLAESIRYIVEKKPAFGIYHRTNDGVCTWFDFARKIIEFKKLKVKIKPMTSDKLDRAAKRPKSSVLLNTKLPKLRHWEEALKEFLDGDKH